MTDLETRMADLRDHIAASEGAPREALLDHLEEAVLACEAQHLPAPGWARALLAARIDREVEEQFDNMPI